MKKQLLTLAFALMAMGAQAQDMYYIKTTGTQLPYTLRPASGIKVLLNRPANDVLSAAQTIPFPFSFYGQTVTKYKASDNGYITFDENATVSVPNNTALDTATEVKNAIFGFWDDLELKQIGTASNILTDVFSYTYGSAGKRRHVIQWFTAAPKAVAGQVGNGYNAQYFAIVLKEEGGFDVIQNYALTSSNALSGTIGAINADGTAHIMVNGSPNIKNPNNQDRWSATTDLVYSFVDGTQPERSVRLNNLNMENNTKISDGLKISGVISNLGSEAITSVTLNWSVNGGPVESEIVKVNAAGGDASPAYFTASWNDKALTAGTFYNVNAWITQINKTDVTPEDTADNRAYGRTLAVKGVYANHNVLVEEGSGGWCGYCPDGHLRLRDILNQYGEPKVIGMVHHNGDGMVNSNSNTINSVFQTGYPYGMVDRQYWEDAGSVGITRDQWSARVSDRLNAQTPVEVRIYERTWDDASRKITFKVKVKATDYYFAGAENNFALNAVILEDKVRGADAKNTWTQHNYFSKSFQGGVGGPNHELYNEPEWLVGYYHNHVVKTMLTGAWGDASVMNTNTLQEGAEWDKTFTYTLPAQVDVNYNANDPKTTEYWSTVPGPGMNKPTEIVLVAFVSYSNKTDVGKNEVINSHAVPLTYYFSDVAPDKKEQAGLRMALYPNPAANLATLDFEMPKTGAGSVEIFNALGQRVSLVREGIMAKGNQSVVIRTEGLENGIYFVTLTANGARTTQRMVVQH